MADRLGGVVLLAITYQEVATDVVEWISREAAHALAWLDGAASPTAEGDDDAAIAEDGRPSSSTDPPP